MSEHSHRPEYEEALESLGEDGKNQPVTLNGLVKWTGIGIAIMTAIISVVWYAGSVTGRVDNNTYRLTEVEKHTEEVNLLAISRHNQEEKEVERVWHKTDEQDKAINEMKAKLDVAIAILERLDKRVDGGK